jgi:hypothetical protein
MLIQIYRPAPLLAQPEGKTLKEKAWAEAIAEAQKVDPQFKAAAI